MPVPVKELVCGEPAALSATVSVAVAEPTAVGVNVTEIVQEEPAARDVPQLFDATAKAEALAPPREMELIARLAVPVLERVKVWAVLVTPVVTLPKLAVGGVSVACAATAAVAAPVSAAVCVPTASVTESVAVKVPADVGVKVTAIVQEAPAAREDPQVLAPWRKLELLAPLIPNEVMESAALPAFVRVKLIGALVVPAVMELKLPVAGVRAACAAAACAPVPVRAAV